MVHAFNDCDRVDSKALDRILDGFYTSEHDTPVEMNVRGTEGLTQVPRHCYLKPTYYALDCVFMFEAGSWHRTSHRMTMIF